MAFWNNKKKEIPQQKASIAPHLPIIEAMGKIAPNFQKFTTRKKYAEIFSEVSEVYSVIMYGADAFSNMRARLFETDPNGNKGEEVFSHDVLTMLENPNALYDWTTLLKLRWINKKVFGNSYILKHALPGFDKEASIWVLPSQFTYAIPTGTSINNLFKDNNKESYLKGYRMFFDRVDYKARPIWSPEQVLHEKEPNVKFGLTTFYADLLEGRSPLETLSEPITNIRKSYEAQNVILKKRGALGLLTPKNNKDNIGVVTVNDTQKKELQAQFQQYGLGEEDWQYIISTIELQWQPMSVPIRELMLFEGIENSMTAICNTYRFPKLLLNYLQGATYANVNELKKSLYQDNIIPEANSFIKQLNNFLGLREQNLLLLADYSHVPILQDDEKTEAEKDKITIDTILQIQNAITSGAVSLEAGNAMLSGVLSLPNELIENILTPPIIQENEIDAI